MSHTPGAGAPLSEEHVPTGVAGVDEVVAAVARLDDRPVAEHVAVFEEAHAHLRRALDDVDGLLGPDTGADPAANPTADLVERGATDLAGRVDARPSTPTPGPGRSGVPRPGPSARPDGGV